MFIPIDSVNFKAGWF